jgi:hypothetical protein
VRCAARSSSAQRPSWVRYPLAPFALVLWAALASWRLSRWAFSAGAVYGRRLQGGITVGNRAGWLRMKTAISHLGAGEL